MTSRPVELSEAETDSVLMAAARKRDREALDALYVRYAEDLYRFLICAGAAEETAAEVIDQLFTRIWRNARRLRPDPTRFRPWIFGLANSLLTAQTTGASQGAGETRDLGTPDRPAPLPLLPLPAQVWRNAEALRRALDRLAPADRRLFVLSEGSRLSYEEIAEAVGQTRPVVASRKAAAVEAVIAAMAQEAQAQGLAGEAEPAAFDAQKARAATAYADGELGVDESASLEKALDAGGLESLWHEEIQRMRGAVRSLAPARLSPRPFERIDQALRMEEQRRQAFRARLALELAALAVAAVLAICGWFAASPLRRDMAKTWMRRAGLTHVLPALPIEREGKRAAWLLLPSGEAWLGCADGLCEYHFSEHAAVLSGDTIDIPEKAGPAHLILPDGSQILARGSTRFCLALSNGAARLRLERGDLWCSLLPREGFLVETPNGLLGSLGGEFNVRVGPASRLKTELAGISGQSASPAAQQTAPASAPAAPPLATWVTVVSGGVALKDGKAALTGETMLVEENQRPLVVDARRGDPALEWSREARQSSPYPAVAQFASLRRRLENTINRASAEPLSEAVRGLMALWPDLTPEEIDQRRESQPLRQQLADVAALEIESIRQVRQSIVLRLRLQRDPSIRTRIVLEEGKDGWAAMRQIGVLFPPSPAEAPKATQPTLSGTFARVRRNGSGLWASLLMPPAGS